MLYNEFISNFSNNKFLKCGIYKIENEINHKVYIGQSIDIRERWYHHCYAYDNNIEYNDGYDYPIYRAMRKYGIENFSFEILIETYDLDYWEKFLIQIYHATNSNFGYNLDDGGGAGWKFVNKLIKNGEINHPMQNHVWTEEQRKHMSKGRKNKGCGENHYFSKMTKEERLKFVKEKSHFTSPWWTNGVINVRAEVCPKGFRKGCVLESQRKLLCLNNNKVYLNQREACDDLGIHPATLSSYIVNRINDETKSVKGYKFKIIGEVK